MANVELSANSNPHARVCRRIAYVRSLKIGTLAVWLRGQAAVG